MATRRKPSVSTPLDDLQERLGYRFRDIALLELALTHRSVIYEARGESDPTSKNKPGTDNEQLEFLGDAVLGLAVSELLMRRFPECDEGELTRIRAALVSRKRMGEMGVALGLSAVLKLGKSAEANGARERAGLAANAAEAVLAAMYLDSVKAGDDCMAAVRDLAERMLVTPDLEAIREAIAGPGHGALRDSKTILQERVQAMGNGRLRYVDIGQEGPAHNRHFTVEARLEREGEQTPLGRGEGASKRDAQQQAAAEALERWPAEGFA